MVAPAGRAPRPAAAPGPGWRPGSTPPPSTPPRPLPPGCRLALMIGAPALGVLLAVGLPLLLLRGGEPGGPVATEATTTTMPPTTTTVVPGLTEWVFQGPVLDKAGRRAAVVLLRARVTPAPVPGHPGDRPRLGRHPLGRVCGRHHLGRGPAGGHFRRGEPSP